MERMRRRRALLIVLGMALATGAAVVVIGGAVGLDPVVTAGLAVGAAVLVTGLTPLERDGPGADFGSRHEPQEAEHGCAGCQAPAKATAHAHAGSRPRAEAPAREHA